MNELQLQMNLDAAPTRNRFREQLNSGEFVLLVENSSPGKDTDPAAASGRLAELESAVLAIKCIPAALAVTDGYHISERSWRAAEYVAALSPENRDRHVLYLSGRHTDRNELKTLTHLAREAGICNLVAVSGDAIRGESARENRKHRFFESIETLAELQGLKTKTPLLMTGATINPFQYSSYSLFAQYGKMIRKINSGAEFIVTQAGWDMLKLQTLRWYLSLRNFFFPTIARLIVLTPERVEKILAGHHPGVNISPDFRKILDKELRFSLNQFEAAQWRRLELQAAGCRLLGYSGIQLSGVDNRARLDIAAERIAAALEEFTSFDHWLSEYNSYLARAEMAPMTASFNLFDRTLRRSYPETPPRMGDIGEPEVGAGENMAWNLRNFLFANSDRQDPDSRRLLKTLFAGCKGCEKCRLPQTEYVCPELCPKRLANGPCGGIRPDGNCEIPNFGECVHRKIARLAYAHDRLSSLEDTIVPSGHSN